MIKSIWGDEATQALVDPEWLKKDKDKVKPPTQLMRGMWVDDIFRTAPYRTPFKIMSLNSPKFWTDGSGQKIRHYRQLPKDIETWRSISVKLPKLLRHTGPSCAYKSAIPCDTGGWFRIADLLRIDPRYWGRDNMTLGFC